MEATEEPRVRGANGEQILPGGTGLRPWLPPGPPVVDGGWAPPVDVTLLSPPSGIPVSPPDGAPVPPQGVPAPSPVLGASLRPSVARQVVRPRTSGSSYLLPDPALDPDPDRGHWSLIEHEPHGRHSVADALAAAPDTITPEPAPMPTDTPAAGAWLAFDPPPSAEVPVEESSDPRWTAPAPANLLPAPSGPPEISTRTAPPLSRRARRAAEQAIAAAATGETKPIDLPQIDHAPLDPAPADYPPLDLGPVGHWPGDHDSAAESAAPAAGSAAPGLDRAHDHADHDTDDRCEPPAFARQDLDWRPPTIGAPEPSSTGPAYPDPIEVAPVVDPAPPEYAAPPEFAAPPQLVAPPVVAVQPQPTALPGMPSIHEVQPVSSGDAAAPGSASSLPVIGLFPGPAWTAPATPEAAGPQLAAPQSDADPSLPYELPSLAEPVPPAAEPVGPPVLAAPLLGPEPSASDLPRPHSLAPPALLVDEPAVQQSAWPRPAIMDDDPTSITRTTSSIPVIRPPAPVRRPDDDSAATTEVRPIRLSAPDAKAIFTMPFSASKGATGPVPSTTEAMPRPVAPKPPAYNGDEPDPAAPYRAAVTLTVPAGRHPGVGAGHPPVAEAPIPQIPAADARQVDPAQVRASDAAHPKQQEEPVEGRAGQLPPARTLASAWPDDLRPDVSRPASTIVPRSGRGRSKVKQRRGKRAEPVPHVRAPAEPAWTPEDRSEVLAEGGERGRLLSVIVFWAPALILLVLAGAVVWVVH